MIGSLLIMKISLLLYEKYLSSTSLETRKNLGRVSSCNHLNGNVSWDDNGKLSIFCGLGISIIIITQFQNLRTENISKKHDC